MESVRIPVRAINYAIKCLNVVATWDYNTVVKATNSITGEVVVFQRDAKSILYFSGKDDKGKSMQIRNVQFSGEVNHWNVIMQL